MMRKIAVALIMIALVNADIRSVADALVKGIRSDKMYDLKDSDHGYGMDCLKVQVDPVSGKFVGIFHHGNSITKYSELYISMRQPNDTKWTSTTKISDRGSQGYIHVIPNNCGFIIAYELENHDHGNRLSFRYYDTLQNILNNFYWYEYQLSAIVGSSTMRNIGTPSIDNASLLAQKGEKQFNEYLVNIKFHYSPDGAHDYPGFGFVYFRPLRDFVKGGKWVGGCVEDYEDWKGLVDTTAQNLLRQADCSGKIGQRDSFVAGKSKYYLYECNINPNFDWKSWRVFIVSFEEKKAMQLPLLLDGNIDLANPHVTQISSNNYLISMFLPSEGTFTPPGHPGECLFSSSISI